MNKLNWSDYRRLEQPLVWSLISLTTLVLLMWPSIRSILNLWDTSDTFAHCYFVLPIFAYLIWRKRALLATSIVTPDWRAIPLILLCGFAWLIAQQTGIQVLEQLFTVLIFILTIWVVIGAELASKIRFALFFLIFLAPIGDELVPQLMELTADLTVWAISVTGIPIYREGLYFTLPTGNWSVVEACSGVRYLIASIVLSSLYAYLQLTTFKWRAIFMILAVIVPIIANSIRAYIIVMLGHVSGNRLATGVDHLVYGWLFFGIVMFILFRIGYYFQEKEPKDIESVSGINDEIEYQHDSSASTMRFLLTWIIVAVSTSAGPAWSMAIRTQSSLESAKVTSHKLSRILPNGTNTLDTNALFYTTSWELNFSGYTTKMVTDYINAHNDHVYASAFIYTDQSQGKEMVSTENNLSNSIGQQWRLGDKRQVNITNSSDATHTESMNAYQLKSANSSVTVLMWYYVDGVITDSEIKAKYYELRSRLLLKNSLSIIYVLASEGEIEENKAKLVEVGSYLFSQTSR